MPPNINSDGILEDVPARDVPLTIRRAEARDVASLLELQSQIYREGRWFVGDGPPSQAALAQRLRALEPHLSLWLLGVKGNRVCGWLELHRLQPMRMRHVATLTLAVSRSQRRRGVGRALLLDSYRWGCDVGVSKISLNVRAGNAAAIRLYREEGFVLEGREQRQIRTADGFEDNLIMAKFLTGWE